MTQSESTDDPYDAGRPGVQYYKVALASGDRLVADFTDVTGEGTGVCVMAPSVTDYTVGDADCLAREGTSGTPNAELQYVAPTSGQFLLAIYDVCCGGQSWAYQMSIRVIPRIAPSISLRGPKSARVHHTIQLHGAVTPALHKWLTLKSKSPAHGWQVAGKTKPVNGHFSFRYYLGHRGKHQFRVFFTGGGSHDSAASKVLRVNVS